MRIHYISLLLLMGCAFGRHAITASRWQCLLTSHRQDVLNRGCVEQYKLALKQSFDTFHATNAPTYSAAEFTDTVGFKPRQDEKFAHVGQSPAAHTVLFDLGSHGQAWHAAHPVWLVRTHQLRARLCQSRFLRESWRLKSPVLTAAVQLRLRQILGMPPLQPDSRGVEGGYGVYVLSQVEPAVQAVCASTSQLAPATSQCQSNWHDASASHRQWVRQWLQVAYPKTWFISGHSESLIAGANVFHFYPWTGVGITYDWGQPSHLGAKKAVQMGVNEYLLPVSAQIGKKALQFIPMERVYAQWCMHNQ